MAFANPFKKKPTAAEQERAVKAQVAADRERADKIMRQLELFRVQVAEMSWLDQIEKDRLRGTTAALIQEIKRKPLSEFDTKDLDAETQKICDNLKKSSEEEGSYETCMFCLQGIAYNYKIARAPIRNKDRVEEVMARRLEMIKRYKNVSILASDVDIRRQNIEDREQKLDKMEAKKQALKSEINRLREEHPEAYEQLKTMAPDEMSKVTGDNKTLAATLYEYINTTRNIGIAKSEIAEEQKQIAADNAQVEQLLLQAYNRESAVDEDTIREIQEAAEDFKHQILEDKAKFKDLDKAMSRISIMIDEALNGNDTKEWQATIWSGYQEVLEQEEQDRNTAAAGRKIYNEEKARNEQQAQQEIENEGGEIENEF
ncbi:MAG: hypothetical protein Q4B15_01955 [Lachnospiraceae bacterium]|nr:hypothetical protein [Lachnospiraceae bacterium]